MSAVPDRYKIICNEKEMSTLNAVKDSNRLIDALPIDEREKLLESSELVHLEFGVTIAKPDECMTEVFFPVSSYVS
jgi:hypothetical protein